MVIIATDSAADFELDELRQLDVAYLPMTVNFGDDSYLENISITKEEFFERLESDENFPKTSQPAPALFEDLFQKARDNGDEVIYIPLSSALSGDYQTAVSIRNAVDYEGIYILDSFTCTGGQRLLVEEAVRLRDEGKSGKEIYEILDELKKRVEIYTVMDTLEYLYKNGRISNAKYYMAKLGHIRPIMHASWGTQGTADIDSKHIGLQKAIRYVAGRFDIEKPDPAFPIYVMYTYVNDNAQKLAELIREKGYEVEDKNIIPVGATVGAHIGRNACAIAYVKEKQD